MPHPDQRPYIIGITGGSGSGKTSFIKALSKHFSTDQISLISQDDYYFPIDRQHFDATGMANFDLPSAIDTNRMIENIQQLASGQSIIITEYTFNNPQAQPTLISINPTPVIIVEGLFIFHLETIRRQLDLSIFIDARDTDMLERRLKRDDAERGYPPEQVRYVWEHHVKPAYEEYLLPFRDQADVIITNHDTFDRGLEVIKHHIEAVLSRDRFDG